ncbi:MAG: FlgD immunoglobulin-like domain containing protein [Acidobacteriota bacterium]
MKKLYTLSVLIALFALLGGRASAQMFTEDFNYAAGDSLTGHGWVVSSGGTTNTIFATSPGLTFTNYPGSGIGSAARIINTGQDVAANFAPDSTGSVYASFLFSVDSAQTGDYFFALAKTGSLSSMYVRTFVKATTGGYFMGVSKNNETPQSYGTTVLSYKTTYLVVLKYTFVAGDKNDLISLYVFPQGGSFATEPATAEVASYNGSSVGDATSLGHVVLRQGSTASSPFVTVDGIRVDSTWKGLFAKPMSYSVGSATIAGEDGHFASMKAALDSLSNGMPIASNITFYITSDITEPETGGIGLGLAVDPSPYVVTFKPAPGVKPVVTLQYPSDGNSGPSGAFIIGMNSAKMAWADLKKTRNIVFDGSNTVGGTTRDLTIQTTGTQRNAIPMAVVGDVSNVTVKNCNILYKVTPAANTSGNLLVYAFLIRSATAGNTGSVEKIPSNITIDNNWLSVNNAGVTASVGGVGGYSAGAISTYPSGIVIRNNKIEGVRHGVAMYYMGSADVYGNEIITNQAILGNVTNDAIYAATTLPSATYNIYNNRITKLAVRDSSLTTGGIAGVSIEGKGTFNVYNNMISGFSLIGSGANKNGYLYGIRVADSAVANIYNNTVKMDTVVSIGTGTVNYRGIYLQNGINTVKNNIVANMEDDFASVNVYRANNGTVGTFNGTLASDFNNLYRAGTKNALTGVYDTTKTAALAAWQTASGQDAKSVSGSPQFVSASDLHINTKASPASAASDAGTPIAMVTKDIDGDTRNATTPDMGADEFTAETTGPVGYPTVTIGEARKDLNKDFIADRVATKDTLVVYGVVTSPNYNQSQTSYFMQDATGGINVFSFTPMTRSFAIGDSIKVTGFVAQYRGLVELTLLDTSSASISVVKKNAVVPAAKRLSVQQFVADPDSYEGQLIEIDSLYKTSGTWPATGSYSSVYVTNNKSKDSVQLFLDNDTDVDGATEPKYPINVTGIISQYTSSSSVYNNGYELMPRGMSDIKPITITSVDGMESGLPKTYELANNFPNPFNPSTVIRFALPAQSMAKLVVYDMLGREVRTLVKSMLNAGYFETTWNGKDNAGRQVSSGIYIYRMEAGSFVSAKKMMLLK